MLLPARGLPTLAGSPAQLPRQGTGRRPNLQRYATEFEKWCKTSWLPSNLGRDYYRRQAETHIQDLANKIGRLQKEIEDRAGNLLDERDRMIQQRLWLQNELDNVGAG